jgi:hypothetical protein
MATNTEKYDLVKPSPDDFYDINVHNANMDKIEAALIENAEGLENYKNSVNIKTVVTVDNGSVVTATNGTDTLTDTATDGSVTFLLPSYGTWTFSATSGGYNSNTVTLEVDTVKVYAVKLTYFKATVTVSVMSGAEVSIYSSDGDAQTAVSTGQVTFTVKEAGTYGIYATYENGVATTSVNVTTSGANYSASLGFPAITVVADAGSTIIVSNGAYTYTKLGTGNDTFWLPQSGTWTVSASLGSNTALSTVTIGDFGHPIVTLDYYKVYGVLIDIPNSNPETAVTYTDDAVGMTGGSTAWDSTGIFKNIKPCVLKNGVVQYYLDPSDFSKKADGTAADITSGNDGDVMIEIPKIGFKIETASTKMIVKVTDNPNASSEGFRYYAHTRTTEGDRDKLYVGAYLGYLKINTNALRSLSNKPPISGYELSTCRSLANNNGEGYDILSFYPLTLLQCLYLIRYKNLNSQAALGSGLVSSDKATNTGMTDTNGMYYGETSQTSHVKFAGIEDFWGNLSYWIDGLHTNSSGHILTAYDNFNTDATNYISLGEKGVTGEIVGYMRHVMGTTEKGFICKSDGGSETTFFSDTGSIGDNSFAAFGGSYDNGSAAGVFRLIFTYMRTDKDEAIGSRLMYL